MLAEHRAHGEALVRLAHAVEGHHPEAHARDHAEQAEAQARGAHDLGADGLLRQHPEPPLGSTTSNASTRSPTVRGGPAGAVRARRGDAGDAHVLEHHVPRHAQPVARELAVELPVGHAGLRPHRGPRGIGDVDRQRDPGARRRSSVSSDGTSDDHENPEATTRTRCPLARASTHRLDRVLDGLRRAHELRAARREPGPVDPRHRCRVRSARRSCSSSSRREPRPVARVEQGLEPEVERAPDDGVRRSSSGRAEGRVALHERGVLVVVDVREVRREARRREHQERDGHAREPAVARAPTARTAAPPTPPSARATAAVTRTSTGSQ